MSKYIFSFLFMILPMAIFGEENNDTDTITIRPIGLDYSKYSGTNKLFMVGECEGMSGNQVVIFQNRPSFDFFENDETYNAEQKELETAIWSEILDEDAEPMILKGRWHKYQDRIVFLCRQIVQINKNQPLAQQQLPGR